MPTETSDDRANDLPRNGCRLFGGNDQESTVFGQSEAEPASTESAIYQHKPAYSGTRRTPRFQIPRAQVRFLPGRCVVYQDIGIALNLLWVQSFFRLGPLGAPVGW
jgi:hypothetical protein